MSHAREAFRARLAGFDTALRDPALAHVGAVSPPDDPARLLRNGIAVVGFNALEDFLKQRMGEVLKRISGGHIPFADLPESLQRGATVGAADALRYQARMRLGRGDFPGARDLVQQTARSMASIDNQKYVLSEISFGYADANLGAEALKQMLSAVGVAGGWSTMIGLVGLAFGRSRADGNLRGSSHRRRILNISLSAQKAGLNLPGLANDYRNALRRRHSAAHDPSTDVPLSDLQAFTRQATAIALAFDALVSRAGYRLRQGDAALAAGSICVDHTQIDIYQFDDGAPQRRQRWGAAVAHAKNTGDVIAITRGHVPFAWRPGDLERGRL